jgi:hypothetical protein
MFLFLHLHPGWWHTNRKLHQIRLLVRAKAEYTYPAFSRIGLYICRQVLSFSTEQEWKIKEFIGAGICPCLSLVRAFARESGMKH